MCSHRQKHIRGVRSVAFFEAVKGLLVLMAGCGVLTLIHRDYQLIAEDLIQHLHFNPANHYSKIFLDLSRNLTDARLWLFALFAFGYSGLRFAEAYGLWWQKDWAEWFAVASGAIYIPFELRELFLGVNALKISTFVINMIIVSYMVWVLKNRYQPKGSE